MRKKQIKKTGQPGGGLTSDGARTSFFGMDLILKGNVVGRSPVYVAGTIHGDVDCGSLVLTGDGVVRGSVRAAQVHLEPGARLLGDVDADVVGVRGDAAIMGRMSCRGAIAPEEPPPAE